VCSISVSQWAKTGSSGKVAKLCEKDTGLLLVKQNLGYVRLELLISFYRMSLSVLAGAIATTTLFCIAARIECHDIFLLYWALHAKQCRENAKLPSIILTTPARCRPGTASFLCNSLFFSMENHILARVIDGNSVKALADTESF
jgi:hypothetical protein